MIPRTAGVQPAEPKGRSGAALAAQAAAGLLVVAALALVYVAPEPPGRAGLALRAAQFALLAIYVLDRLVRLLRAPHAGQFLREHWMDLVLLAVAAGLLAAGAAVGGRVLAAAGLYVLLSRSWFLVPVRRLPAVLNVVLALIGGVAVAALVLEYGFREPLPVPAGVLHAVQTVVLAILVLDRIVRLELARSRRAYLKENWVEFVLMAAAAFVVGIGPRVYGQVLSAGALYLIITQAYILVALVLRGVSVNLDFAGSGIDPAWLLIVSFAVLCLAGSGLLMLPAATPQGIQPPLYYDEALFTSVSATCVTGLVVRDTGRDFTPFGQAVILGLLQLGGLGIMLFGTVLALLAGKGLSVRSSSALGEMLATEGIGRLTRVVKFVVASTLALEALGAAVLYPMFAGPQGEHLPTAGRAAWDSAFHSISAFCNAGFSLYGGNMQAGVQEGWARPFREHWQVLGVMAPLIVLGGVGFPVIQDCAAYARDALVRAARRRRAGWLAAADVPKPRLSLHSKTVLATTGALIVLGAGGFLLLAREMEPPRLARHELLGPGREVRNDPRRLRNMPLGAQVREAVFQSVTARTAGFNTVDMAKDLPDSGRLWMCGLMLVGGSPASTAGGMKTVTFAVLVLAAWSMIKRRNDVEAFRRTIPELLLRRAITVAVLYLALVGAVTMLLCVAMPRWNFMDLLFEACSACGTVGLSTGVTPKLGLMGKLVVIAGMFAGRVGPLTMLLALTTHMRHVRYSYPSGNVVIG